MANQPKKYKKFVTTAATATLVASAIVPVASAAGFKDVPQSNSHVEAINALAEQGIINGFADGTFKPDQSITRGQVVKLLGRWLEAQGQEIPTDWKSEKRFNDLAVDSSDSELVKYAALAKDAGVFNGSNGNLNASQNITRQQMAVVLVRAIKEINGVDLVAEYKNADFDSSVTDLDKAYSSEQTDAIKALEFAELTTVTKFRPTEDLTRGQFASFLYRTINLDITEGLSATVKAINATTVEVTFDNDIENIKDLDFTIKGLEVTNAIVKQTAKNVAVLTTEVQTADKEYTVSVDGNEIGKFKGIGVVIPTSIKVETTSVQSKVGQQVTLKATTTPGAQVTFNVQATGNSLNENKKHEVTAGTDGVATYSYTQYGVAGVDNITVYPTGAPSLLGYAKVYWGQDTILSVDADAKTVDNGANRTYTVTYKDPTTGQPVSGKKLNVTFKENLNDIDNSKTNDTTASIRKENGLYVTPYQDSVATAGSNREEEFEIVTNSLGQATFIVTGKNTTATPVVFVDENNDNRFGATELQVNAGDVKFQGVQTPYTITWDKTADFVAAMSSEYGQQNPIAYKLKVVTDKKDKDGNPVPYIGASIKVAIQQNQDATLTNNTPAQIATSENGVYTTNGVVTVTTNDKGEATVYLKSAVDNTKATPVAWIDLNTAGNSATVGNDRLEDGEPNAVAPTVTFLKSVVVAPAYTLNTPTAGPFIDMDIMSWKASLSNQSGNVSETAGVKNATFTITNTSNAIQTINPRLVDAAGNNYSGLTITYNGATQTQTFANGNSVRLEPGTTVTIHGVAPGLVNANSTVAEYSNTNDAVLNVVAPNTSGKLSVSSYVTTVRKLVTGDVRNNNNTYTYEAKEAEFVVSTLATTTVTGEVIGYEVVDNKFGANNYGRVLVKERFTGSVKHYYYNGTKPTTFSIGLNADFTGVDNVVGSNATIFENLITLGDQIQVNGAQYADVRLFNKDNSTSTTQAKGNGVASPLSIVSAATREVGTANGSVDQVVVTFNNAINQNQINALQSILGTKILTGVTLNHADYALANPQLVAGSSNQVAFTVVNKATGTANTTIDTALFAGNTITFDTTAASALGGTTVALTSVIKDATAPVIVSHTTADKDGANGLDTINFVFSEAIDASSIDEADFRFAVPGMVAPGYVSGKVGSAAWNASSKTLTVEFDNTTPHATSSTLTFEYAASNSATFNKAVKDLAGNELKPVGATNTGNGNGNGNGGNQVLSKYIDASKPLQVNAFGEYAIAFTQASLTDELAGATTLKLNVNGTDYNGVLESGYFVFAVPTSASEADVKAGKLSL